MATKARVKKIEAVLDDLENGQVKGLEDVLREIDLTAREALTPLEKRELARLSATPVSEKLAKTIRALETKL
jgi:hypothetical protein